MDKIYWTFRTSNSDRSSAPDRHSQGRSLAHAPAELDVDGCPAHHSPVHYPAAPGVAPHHHGGAPDAPSRRETSYATPD